MKCYTYYDINSIGIINKSDVNIYGRSKALKVFKKMFHNCSVCSVCFVLFRVVLWHS